MSIFHHWDFPALCRSLARKPLKCSLTLCVLLASQGATASSSFGVSDWFELDLKATGPIFITDDVGGASVELDGEALQGSSPLDITDIPFGKYVVTAYKEGVLFEEGSIIVDLNSKAGAQAHFVLSNVQFSQEYSAWLDANFTLRELSDWQIVGAAADADGDGTSNEFEFVAQLDPKDASSRFVAELKATPGINVEISPLNEGVSFRLESSEDLAFWTPVPESAFRVDGDQLIIDEPQLTPRGFYRIAILGDNGEAETLLPSD